MTSSLRNIVVLSHSVSLHPPDKTLVFIFDETPQVQALDRTAPVLPLRPGTPARQTHDYVRHGTTNLFAALNVLDGTVLARCAARRRHTEFLAFLQQLDRAVPNRGDIHLILDNYGTHTHPTVEALVRGASALSPALRSTSASWRNLVERRFADIPPKRIRRATVRSLADLIRAIEEYVAHHGEPFIWTARPRRRSCAKCVTVKKRERQHTRTDVQPEGVKSCHFERIDNRSSSIDLRGMSHRRR